MLKQLELENFKPFCKKQQVPLAAINLIYGPNSCGKSSLIQSLLLMRQSLQGRRLTTKGDIVDLGNFKSILHGHDLERELRISIDFDSTKVLNRYPEGTYLNPISCKKIEALFKASRANDSEPAGVLSEVRYLCNSDPEIDISLRHTGQQHFSGSRFAWSSHESAASLLTALGRSNSLFNNLFGSGSLDTLSTLSRAEFVAEGLLPGKLADPGEKDPKKYELLHEAQECLYEFISAFHNNLEALNYLGPLRSYPERFYPVAQEGNHSVGSQGEHVTALLHYQRETLLPEVNAWFEHFEIPYSLDITSIGNEITGEIVVMCLKDKRTGVSVAPSDVGFGIGQLLPILVEGMFTSGEILCVEQPEIHLHPRLQAHIADFLISTSGLTVPLKNFGENLPTHKQWIVETHSEALMLRLQRRIREGQISPDDVCVLYVEENGNRGSRVLRLRLDEQGEFIDEWPDGFFEESYQEMFGQEEVC